MTAKCAIEDCDRMTYGRHSLCALHRKRLDSSGDILGDRPVLPQLPSAPLVAFVERHGGISEYGVSAGVLRAYVRAKTTGSLTVFKADELAHQLAGCHPWEIWPEWFRWAVDAR